MAGVPHFSNRGSNSFQRVADAFLAQPGLPFANVLSAERIERIFTKHGNLFGAGAIYSTAVMLWSFLGQVLLDRKQASCQAAVARIVTFYRATATGSVFAPRPNRVAEDLPRATMGSAFPTTGKTTCHGRCCRHGHWHWDGSRRDTLPARSSSLRFASAE